MTKLRSLHHYLFILWPATLGSAMLLASSAWAACEEIKEEIMSLESKQLKMAQQCTEDKVKHLAQKNDDSPERLGCLSLRALQEEHDQILGEMNLLRGIEELKHLANKSLEELKAEVGAMRFQYVPEKNRQLQTSIQRLENVKLMLGPWENGQSLVDLFSVSENAGAEEFSSFVQRKCLDNLMQEQEGAQGKREFCHFVFDRTEFTQELNDFHRNYAQNEDRSKLKDNLIQKVEQFLSPELKRELEEFERLVERNKELIAKCQFGATGEICGTWEEWKRQLTTKVTTLENRLSQLAPGEEAGTVDMLVSEIKDQVQMLKGSVSETPAPTVDSLLQKVGQVKLEAVVVKALEQTLEKRNRSLEVLQQFISTDNESCRELGQQMATSSSYLTKETIYRRPGNEVRRNDCENNHSEIFQALGKAQDEKQKNDRLQKAPLAKKKQEVLTHLKSIGLCQDTPDLQGPHLVSCLRSIDEAKLRDHHSTLLAKLLKRREKILGIMQTDSYKKLTIAKSMAHDAYLYCGRQEGTHTALRKAAMYEEGSCSTDFVPPPLKALAHVYDQTGEIIGSIGEVEAQQKTMELCQEEDLAPLIEISCERLQDKRERVRERVARETSEAQSYARHQERLQRKAQWLRDGGYFQPGVGPRKMSLWRALGRGLTTNLGQNASDIMRVMGPGQNAKLIWQDQKAQYSYYQHWKKIQEAFPPQIVILPPFPYVQPYHPNQNAFGNTYNFFGPSDLG